ncbi:MAG: hypothetical protein OEY79_02500 [Anaplasmataceae bacterium]|nr:hypothetical protein [Anaplasmataceae bacterium]
MFDDYSVTNKNFYILISLLLTICLLFFLTIFWQKSILIDEAIDHNIELYNLKVNADKNKINTEVSSMLNLSKNYSMPINMNIEFDFVKGRLNDAVYSMPYFIDFIIDSSMKYGIANSTLNREKLFKVYLNEDKYTSKYNEIFIDKILHKIDKIKITTIIKEVIN